MGSEACGETAVGGSAVDCELCGLCDVSHSRWVVGDYYCVQFRIMPGPGLQYTSVMTSLVFTAGCDVLLYM
jgi:hypothetical protein